MKTQELESIYTYCSSEDVDQLYLYRLTDLWGEECLSYSDEEEDQEMIEDNYN